MENKKGQIENKEETNKKEETEKKDESFDNAEVESQLITIQKYISLLIIEFKEHIQKYNLMFQDISHNTNLHFEKFDEIINEYIEEIKQNQMALFDMLSKMSIINEELPKLEELFYKIKEMRMALEQVYKDICKKYGIK